MLPQQTNRLAVTAATLSEARRKAIAAVVERCVAIESRDREHAWVIHDTCRAIGSLTGSGGTVGPLPDGTYVEVAVLTGKEQS